MFLTSLQLVTIKMHLIVLVSPTTFLFWISLTIISKRFSFVSKTCSSVVIGFVSGTTLVFLDVSGIV